VNDYPCFACGDAVPVGTALCPRCRAIEWDKFSSAPKALGAKHKTTLPPTEKQLERINELKDLPEFRDHLDWLLTAVNKGMLNTRGQAGILISQMKKKLENTEESGVNLIPLDGQHLAKNVIILTDGENNDPYDLKKIISAGMHPGDAYYVFGPEDGEDDA
jgi:hypothetical protein